MLPVQAIGVALTVNVVLPGELRPVSAEKFVVHPAIAEPLLATQPEFVYVPGIVEVTWKLASAVSTFKNQQVPDAPSDFIAKSPLFHLHLWAARVTQMVWAR